VNVVLTEAAILASGNAKNLRWLRLTNSLICALLWGSLSLSLSGIGCRRCQRCHFADRAM